MSAALDRIRALNPQYNDIPDADLVPILHQEFAPNKPIADVYKNLGISNPEEEAGAIRSYGVLPLLKGVSNIGGVVGYGLEKAGFEEAGKELQESDVRAMEALSARQSAQAREDAAKTIIDKEGNYGGYNPGTLIQDVLQSLPGMAVMGAAGAPLATGISTISKAAGVGKAVKGISGFAGDAAKLDEMVGSALGFGASEGAFSGAQNASQVQQQIYNTDYQTLATSPQFQIAYHDDTEQSLSHEERLKQAKDIVAQKAGDAVFAQTLLETGGTSALTGGGVFGMMRGKKEAVDSILKSVVKGFFTEGGQEAVQSGLEQRAQNLAIQQYANPEQNVNEGVLNAILQGGIAGGALGGGGAYVGNKFKPEQPEQEKPEVDPIKQIASSSNVDEAIANASQALTEPQKLLPQLVFDKEGNSYDKNELVRRFMEQGYDQPTANAYIEKITTPEIKAEPLSLESYNALPTRTANIGGILAPAPKTQDEYDALQERLAIQSESNVENKPFDEAIPFNAKTRAEIADEWEQHDLANQILQEARTGQKVAKPITPVAQAEPIAPVKLVTPVGQITPIKTPAIKLTEAKAPIVTEFTPTHELTDGTPVVKVSGETNIYTDASGNEWEAPDAIPLTSIQKTQVAPNEPKTTTEIPQYDIGTISAGNAPAVESGEAPTTIPNAEEKVTSPSFNIGKVGGQLAAGEIVTTSSGRQTTPFPKFQTKEGNIKPVHIKAIDKWLMKNALEEANSRGDEFNAKQFEANLDKPSQADKDSAEEYLFGQQPETKQPILKPLSETITPLQEEENAKQEQETTQPNGSRGAQPRVREEGEDTTEGREGIRGGRQEERNTSQELVDVFSKLGKQGINKSGEKLIKQRSDTDIITTVQNHWLDVLADVGYEKENKSDNPNGKVFIQC